MHGSSEARPVFFVPVWLAEALGSIVLAGICIAVYVKTHERFMAHWLLGWILAMPGGSPVSSTDLSVLLIAYEAVRIAASYFLLLGNHEFHGRKIPRGYQYWALGTLGWVAIAFPMLHELAPRPFYRSLLLPSLVFQSVAFIVSGRMFLKSTTSRPLGRLLAGWGYVLMGAHLLDYPFLYNVPGNDRWGYLIAFVLGLSAALGAFLVYFDTREQESRRETVAKEQAEAALVASEARYRELADLLPETVFEVDSQGMLTFGNRAGFRSFGYSLDDLSCGLNVFDMIDPDQVEEAKLNLGRALDDQPRSGNEYTGVRKDGSRFPIIIRGTPIVRDGKVEGLRGIIVDITDIKDAQDQLRFLSLHDPLTGLFNRTYFEQQVRKTQGSHSKPAGMIVTDMDGLKLVNDTMGHATGDMLLSAAARVISDVFHHGDVIARVGGDEFAVLMMDLGADPKATIEDACRRLEDSVNSYNLRHPELSLHLSIGYAIGENAGDLDQLFKQADDHMYREKLHRSQSTRNSIVQTMMKTLEARDYATEHHAERLERLVTAVDQAVGLPSQRMADLRLLAQFHDIGKVGIPDSILFKPGPLGPKQRTEINRHSEIGYRIAQAAPDLAPIADWILKHHEWWDGNGYPLGLKGEDIPLECRILAIADAYDAMTSERPYRKKLASEQAVEELNRCAGTQFDPSLVKVFVHQVESRSESVAT
jgi:diguanylate cyclase (GGDEF)-like protein/PAS domain S-box-containing protein